MRAIPSLMASVLLPLLMTFTAAAQNYPNRTVRLIVPFGAGGPADVYARVLAQRLIETLARPAIINSVALDCGASVGLSYSEGAEPTRVLVRQADTALYAAKDQGRGRWTEYNGIQ